MRSFIKNKKAAGFLAAVILLISVMMAAVIGAVVFFAFADDVADNAATSSASYTDTISGTVDIWIPLDATPGGTPGYNVSVTNATATRYLSPGATGYEYISSNNTMRVDAVSLEAADTQIDVTFNTRAHDATDNIITYAVTVFALVAILPLILVGGLMLRSIGLWGGGKDF